MGNGWGSLTELLPRDPLIPQNSEKFLQETFKDLIKFLIAN